ncbi:hypothetical protein H0H93_003766 [Arthromyces matolae]|nr:hypothetical protein H0H93_003766 [Arthromyces matolae]
MGGNAFAALLSPAAFPRIPPIVYHTLKSRLQPKILSLYEHVAVPFEAPEKTSHGDVDFIVSCPRDKIARDLKQVNAPHDLVKQVVGSRHANLMEENRTSNFALPVAMDEWRALGHEHEENEARSGVDDGEIYYQESTRNVILHMKAFLVDIHVCMDKAEFDRIVFFHSYGDLGMIMGLLGRNAGLALGEKGLKLPNPPHPPLELSESFDDILRFMGWSMDTWKAGFHTRKQAFEWAASTKFFEPRMFRSHGEGISKVKADRKMYAEFVQWVEERASSSGGPRLTRTDEQLQALRDSALEYFGKKSVFDAMAREREEKAILKQVFSGARVRDWAELGEHWKGVKLIMDGVREKFGGNEGVLKLYNSQGEEGIKKVVLEEQQRLGL